MNTIVNDLRELADFLETRPTLAAQLDHRYSIYATADEFPSLARALGGKRQKDASSDFFGVTRNFGDISLRVFSDRDQVCQRKVVGTREVPEQVIPEKVIPAHTEEIVEWECPDSILREPLELANEDKVTA